MIIFYQSIKSFKEFLDSNIIYADWKPANILIDFDGRKIMFGDWGCCIKITEGNNNYIKGCDPNYCDPKTFQNLQANNKKKEGDEDIPMEMKDVVNNEIYTINKTFIELIK